MPEQSFQLILNLKQQHVLFVQILTYLLSFAYPHLAVPQFETMREKRQTIEQLQEVSYSVRPWRENPEAFLALSFSPEAAGAIKSMITTLQAVYELWPQHQDSLVALQDLIMFRTLVEEAEQRASAGAEGKEQ